VPLRIRLPCDQRQQLRDLLGRLLARLHEARRLEEAAVNDSPRSPKLRDWHLNRWAIVYVRQSTPQQVIDHQESTARQYALADRAVDLGWSAERVLIIDEDLGRSGQSVEGRPGFRRLLAEVALDRVGLILGLEMSRLARSCKACVHGPMVTVVQQRTRCGRMKADPAAIGPEATPECGVSVRSAQHGFRFVSG
jgi:hypothetical protein